ncbi:hypothetical protein [Roseovarius sp. MMSF_3350]|uniref:hypothetical protein n=1 Tax=Roseovarius sp. MMSF_3350 TaxID=3046706 RepID=UPI00273EA883|nr:hypothetical protein [Roseovarius sp. MMSF_3350]
MPVVQWVGQSLQDDDNQQSNTSRLLNLYRERHGDKYILKSVLGTSILVDLPSVFIRAMEEIEGELYAVNGGKLYRIDGGTGPTRQFAELGGEWYEVQSGGINPGGGGIMPVDPDDTTCRVSGFVDAVEIGTISDAADTTMAGNNGAITIAAGGEYYNVASDGTVTTPLTGAFDNVGSVDFIGQRTVITEKNGRRFGWSDVADSTSFDGLDFASAESRDDDIIRGMAIGPQYWIFGERSIERWYLTGSGESTTFLQPVSGADVDFGLKAFGLVSKFPNGAFFVGTNNKVLLISGGSMKPVSTRGVETSITQGRPQSCFYYQDEAHEFCVIQFKDRPAWVYDLVSNEWHERAEGIEFGPWSASVSAKHNGVFFVGTASGQIRRLERSNKEADGPLWRRAISSTLENDGKRFTVSRVQMQVATGIVDVSGRAPEIMFRMSKDRARTWGRERWRDTGVKGDYDKLVTLNALGQYRRATLEATMTDKAEIPLESTAFIEVA